MQVGFDFAVGEKIFLSISHKLILKYFCRSFVKKYFKKPQASFFSTE
jgi:hypothetical protein